MPRTKPPAPGTDPKHPAFFATPAELRRWLERHHESERELWVGYYKKATGRPSITWQESVDEALCFGWIDGVRKTVDAESYTNRFTPRRRGSKWSAVNIGRVEALTREGRMRPAGLAAYEARLLTRGGGVYAHQQQTEQSPLDAAAERQIRANPAAWRFFQAQPPGYRKLATRFVMEAKREETRQRRLERLIADSAAGRRIGLLQRPEKGAP